MKHYIVLFIPRISINRLSSISRLRNQYCLYTRLSHVIIAWTSGKLTFYKLDSRGNVIRITGNILRMDVGKVLHIIIHACGFFTEFKERKFSNSFLHSSYKARLFTTRELDKLERCTRGNLAGNFARQSEEERERGKERLRLRAVRVSPHFFYLATTRDRDVVINYHLQKVQERE